MAQSITQVCTHCNTPVPAHVSFCPNCGTPAPAANGNAANFAPTQKAPPPPYTAYPPQAQPASQPAPGQQPYQPPLQSSQPPPAYARPLINSSGGFLKVGVILLILLLLLGAGGFFAFRYVPSRGGNTANTGVNKEITPTQAQLSTTPINATFTYASVTITIINAQQAASFADDTNTSAPGTVRLNLHAVPNGTDDTNSGSSIDPYYHYSTSFALLLPGGKEDSSCGL